MPQFVPVSDFRSDIRTVSRNTDEGEVVVFTQNGRPCWAMVDYDEWNAAASVQERSVARALAGAEELERAGKLDYVSEDEYERRRQERKDARRPGAAAL